MSLLDAIKDLVRESHTHTVYGRIPDKQVLDIRAPVAPFGPGEGYFQIKLSEMFLKDKRRYWHGFVPMAIVLSDFLFGDHRRSVPTLVGNNLLESIEEVRGQHVEYKNTVLVGPVPYLGGDISLFLGLFRVQVDDLSRQLFELVETMIGACDITHLTSYLNVAKGLSDGLAFLFKSKEMELQLGSRNVFADVPGEPNCFRQGYFVYVNCEERDLDVRKLRVKGNSLRICEAGTRHTPYDDYDYCLVKVSRLGKRNDYTTMPFHRTWHMAQDEIYKGNLTEADRLFLLLIHQLATEPGLTRRHGFQLIQLYEAHFEKEVELYLRTKSRAASRIRATRGPRSGKDAVTVITDAAYTSAKRGLKEAQKGLLDVGKNIDGILGDRAPRIKLTDELLNTQLDRLSVVSRTNDPDPVALAKAIAADALDPWQKDVSTPL